MRRHIAQNISADIHMTRSILLLSMVMTMEVECPRNHCDRLVRQNQLLTNNQCALIDFIKDFFIFGVTNIVVAANENFISFKFAGTLDVAYITGLGSAFSIALSSS